MSSQKTATVTKRFKLSKNLIILIVLVGIIAITVSSCAIGKAVSRNQGERVLDAYLSAAKSQNVTKMAATLYPKGSEQYKAFVSDYNAGKKEYKSYAKSATDDELEEFKYAEENLTESALDRGLSLATEKKLAKNIKSYSSKVIVEDKNQVVMEVTFSTDVQYRASDLPGKYSDYVDGNGVASTYTLSFKRDAQTKKWTFASGFRLISGQEAVGTWTASYGDGAELKRANSKDATGTYDLTSFEENIISIGPRAFENCTELKKLIVPNSLVNISKYAFKGCTSLESITFEDGTSINADSNVVFGEGAFWGCEKLDKIDFPAVNKDIPSYLFYGCKALSTNVTIPEDASIIGHYAFYNCAVMTTVNIPDSVKTIGDSAFEGCERLTTFRTTTSVDGMVSERNVLSTNITRMGTNVFKNCILLDSATLPANLTEISKGMFEGCVRLSHSPISETVKEIGTRAFKNTLITEVALPISVEKIGSEAFSGSAVTNVLWQEGEASLRTIGEKAFFGCEKLASIELPESVKGIGAQAFDGCISMRTVMVDFDSSAAVGEHAFSMSEGIPKIYVNNDLNIFRQKWFLMDLEIYSQDIITEDDFAILEEKDSNGDTKRVLVQYIGIKDVLTLDTTITHIGDGAFAHSLALTNITNFGDLNALVDIGDDVFAGCKKMKFDQYGNAGTGVLNYLGKWLISGKIEDKGKVLDLRRVNGANKYDTTKAGITKNLPDTVGIAASAFINTSINTIYFSENVKYIGKNAFSQVTNLTTVDLTGSKLVKIGEEAFYSCVALDSITLPSSVVELGERAFQYCDALRYVVINSSANVVVGTDAFTINYSTPKLYINNFANNAAYTDLAKNFAGTYNSRNEAEVAAYNALVASINEVIFDANVIKTVSNVLIAEKSGELIQLLDIETYENMVNASTASAVLSGLTSIGAGAFAKSAVTEVTLPSTIKNIEKYAFYDCTKLLKLTFEAGVNGKDSLEFIGTHAFRGTTTLSENDNARIEFKANTPNQIVMGEDPFETDSLYRKVFVSNRSAYVNGFVFWKDNANMLNADDDPVITVKVTLAEEVSGTFNNTTDANTIYGAVTDDNGVVTIDEAPNAEITIEAKPDTDNGFEFSHWIKNNGTTAYSYGKVITFVIADGDEYIAVFKRTTAKVTLSISGITSESTPAGSVYKNENLTGEIEGKSSVEFETNKGFTLYAEAVTGFEFAGWYWTDSEELIGMGEGDNFAMLFNLGYDDIKITAKFVRITVDITVDYLLTEGLVARKIGDSYVTLAYDDVVMEDMGYGTTFTLVATPNEGYVFAGWEIDDEVVSTANEYTFIVSSVTNYSIKALFEQDNG